MRTKKEMNEKIDLICVNVVRFTALCIAVVLVLSLFKECVQ